MSEPASISAAIARRYATAVFELAKEGKTLGTLESDIDALDAALGESADFTALVASPIYSRQEQQAAIGELAELMGLSIVVANTLRLMAGKRRLFVLPQLLAALRLLISEEKGEIRAEVTAASALSKSQSDELARALKAVVGKTVKIEENVDESLIGGLIVKVGSKMIDTSIRAKLNSLQNSMKEVG
ncbi:MAG: F0F1 ATP synthase subunit delta [Halocynthiibacter sp.]